MKKAVGCEVIDPREMPLEKSAYDHVMDAVGAKVAREQALAAIKPGGVFMQVGLQDWASEIDMRTLTLAEITLLGTYTYTTADLRATVAALHQGQFGNLDWVDERPLADGPQAFVDLDSSARAAPKIVLLPRAPRRAPESPAGAARFLLMFIAKGCNEVSRACLMIAISALGLMTSIARLARAGWRTMLLVVAATL